MLTSWGRIFSIYFLLALISRSTVISWSQYLIQVTGLRPVTHYTIQKYTFTTTFDVPGPDPLSMAAIWCMVRDRFLLWNSTASTNFLSRLIPITIQKNESMTIYMGLQYS